MKRSMDYMRMTQDAMETALHLGYYEDMRPFKDYFQQRRSASKQYAMPDIVIAWPDDWEDPSHPLIAQCELCGKEDVYDVNNCGFGIGIACRPALSSYLFKGHTPPVSPYTHMCLDCYKRSIPYQIKLREVVELRYYVNSLERAIRERRSKDNRSNTNHACQRGEGSSERRP